jgi:hypothetical protein
MKHHLQLQEGDKQRMKERKKGVAHSIGAAQSNHRFESFIKATVRMNCANILS